MSTEPTDRRRSASTRVTPAYAFRTELGGAVLDDALDVLAELPPASCQLILASPPFTGPGEIGEDDPAGGQFVDWLLPFLRHFERVLKPNGSLVLELGATWLRRQPIRTVQNFNFISTVCSQGRWHLLQEFYWYNPAFLERRPEWTDDGHARFHDCVTVVWWLSRSPQIEVDTRRVLDYYSAFEEPRGNFLTVTDGVADQAYLDWCRATGNTPHPDRFPVGVPRFFIELLTEPLDLVIDPFAGTCTSGLAAEGCGRRWLCIERNPAMLEIAAPRFGRA